MHVSFGADRNKWEECPVNDWINEGLVSFIWNEGVYYKAYVSKLDKVFHSSRNYPKPFVENDAHSVWKSIRNSTFRGFNKKWNIPSVYCDLCDECVHWKLIDKDIYEKHHRMRNFDNNPFLCSNWVETIKINLDQCHNNLELNLSLRLD